QRTRRLHERHRLVLRARLAGLDPLPARRQPHDRLDRPGPHLVDVRPRAGYAIQERVPPRALPLEPARGGRDESLERALDVQDAAGRLDADDGARADGRDGAVATRDVRGAERADFGAAELLAGDVERDRLPGEAPNVLH